MRHIAGVPRRTDPAVAITPRTLAPSALERGVAATAISGVSTAPTRTASRAGPMGRATRRSWQRCDRHGGDPPR
ncbi:hypothetical protein XI38_05485 [Microbacterium aurantiacum]|uniref:Uncharacterized protein n=1 Tax=Microbacterium aurantiacum TaxID=162393 RepID=A0A0M9VLL5_9MICO|nr:hypothetical protein XI38_05485 [Microbacterium chocolatum]